MWTYDVCTGAEVTTTTDTVPLKVISWVECRAEAFTAQLHAGLVDFNFVLLQLYSLSYLVSSPKLFPSQDISAVMSDDCLLLVSCCVMLRQSMARGTILLFTRASEGSPTSLSDFQLPYASLHSITLFRMRVDLVHLDYLPKQ